MKILIQKLQERWGNLFNEQELSALEKITLTDVQREELWGVLLIAVDEIGLNQMAILSILLKDTDAALERFDTQVGIIVRGLKRVEQIYQQHEGQQEIETENFRHLLLAMAEDVRVVLIMIAERVYLMRKLNSEFQKFKSLEVPKSNTTDSEYSTLMDYGTLEHFNSVASSVARETSLLYSPLAHRLGLYSLKTELEDLSLKFTEYEVYKSIAHALNEKKAERDKYITAFITPLQKKLQDAGFQFVMKGRTKSIHSIYQKMKKQQTTVEGIYDLFAIRIILDANETQEKAQCWQVYSIITDMYQPNPKRMRDWLSIPKSNGYESLHATVLGPENKWVEVQIRSRRMDEIAEKGVAAHWRYKGVKDEGGMADFLRNVREMLEADSVDTKDALEDFKLNFYDQEVFVFTPNGDLFRLPKGATVLDFAFAIHSNLGCRCVGGKIGQRAVPIRHQLHNGDQVEILTSPQQKPTEAWLNIVCTSKARNKIRQSLKEQENKQAAEGKELLARRFKNWKIEADESRISQISKKLGYKAVNQFYQSLAVGQLDILHVREVYEELKGVKGSKKELKDDSLVSEIENHLVDTNSAANFQLSTLNSQLSQDELVIDQNLKNVDYKLAKCCNPIFGDKIFGFVSVTKGISIHRDNCPNALELKSRYGYRIVPARWSGKAVGQNYPVTLRVVGNDDIGIVTNITSLINKENGVLLRTISIDSHDGLFEGHLTLLVPDLQRVNAIVQKITTVKGIKQVTRG